MCMLAARAFACTYIQLYMSITKVHLSSLVFQKTQVYYVWVGVFIFSLPLCLYQENQQMM